LSVKVERPHESIGEAGRQPNDDGGSGDDGKVRALSLSPFPLLLSVADGKHKSNGGNRGRGEHVQGRGGSPGLYRGDSQEPALIMAAGMSCHNPRNLGNRVHASCKIALSAHTFRLNYRACRYPSTVWNLDAFITSRTKHGP
jgi:hypothetical protein